MAKQDPILMADESLNIYVEMLLKEANISTTPADYYQAYKTKLASEVNRRIGLLTMNELEKKDLEEFEKILNQGGDQDKIQKLISSKIPNLEQVIKKGLDQFAAEFLVAAGK